MQINWTISALTDLDLEMDYLSNEVDEDFARKVYEHIQNKIANLKNFPSLGREGRIFGTRELILTDYSYIIPYCVRGNTIEIIAIFHTKKQLPNTW